MTHRASMPGSTGGKQVAIVQPQRRDTSDHIDKSPPKSPPQANKRLRTSKGDLETSMSEPENEKAKRKSSARVSPKTTPSNLQNTTKATLWIESRKSSPRKSNKIQTPPRAPVLKVRRNTASAKKSTPLRLAVLKRAQSAQKMKVTKIEAPLKMDHTKQAAILLMTGHAAKCKQPTAASNSPPAPPHTPVTILDVTESGAKNSPTRTSSASRRSGQRSLKKLQSISPRKSALKDPSAKRGTRKTESIKFDLSNLENHSQDSEILMLTDTTKQSCEGDSASDDEITLRYSESSGLSPSPRRSIHSRSAHILENTLGAARYDSGSGSGSARNDSGSARKHSGAAAGGSAPAQARPKRSVRGSLMIQKALNDSETLSYSRRTTKSVSDSSKNTTVASAYRTRTLSPRTPRNDLESYSIVDLVSIDTDESARSTSVYNSAGSAGSTMFGTPQNSTGRKTRSTIDPTLLGSSTPYVKGRASTPRSRSNPNINTSSKSSMNDSQFTTRSTMSRRSKSLSTPENTEDAKKHISVNSTRISRASRSRSRINDSDLLLLDDDDDSPRTSKRFSTTSKSTRSSLHTGSNNIDITPVNSPAQNEGICTPENRHSPEEASTPVLSIQSLLDSSQSSLVSQRSTKRGRPSLHANRKTIGGITGPKTRVGPKSKSMNFSARKTRLRLSSDSVEALNKNYDKQDGEIVTPKSAVKLVQEGVKNKHSTAKKPQSKRSIIDDLNESDIVKQLFNSPVKRKLSQSMTEFSRKQLFEDDDIVQVKRPTRNTIALTGRTPDNSLFDHTESYTPEIFVSPISTPRHSPNLEGIKLLFASTTPENDLRNVRGVKGLLRTPRTRRSTKNDLTNVSGVKKVFAKSPKNSLSDVRVKEVFASSPKNDLRQVSGVKTLFRSTKKRKSPRNNLDDVRGVKKLFKTRSPVNDLRNVSGVKKTLRRNSPKNDLSDVRGVKRMFRRENRNDLNDVSGVEELFNASNQSHRDADSLFDQLIGKPQIKAVYSKTFTTKSVHKTKGRQTKTFHESLDVIANDVEAWLEQELNKRLHKAEERETSSRSGNKSNVNMTRELQKLVTDTEEGNEPMCTSRIRDSTIMRSNESDRKKSASELYSAHKLPIKKRSLVEAALDKSNKLPLKKRAVPHSTPLKGGARPAMDVSPIASCGEPHIFTTIYQSKESPIAKEQKSRRGTKAKTEHMKYTNAPEVVQLSPKKTRAKRNVASPKTKPVSPTKEEVVTPVNAKTASRSQTKSTKPVKKATSAKTKSSKPAKKTTPKKTEIPSPAKELSSPVPAKTTRSRKKDVSIPESNMKKRRATLVVTKKSPVMSPKPRATRKRKEPETPAAPKPSPKKTRATRKNESVKHDEKTKTPKNTRAKVQKATVVVSKPSPQLKPRATRTRGQAESDAETTRNTRKTVIVEEKKPESLKKSQGQRKLLGKTQAEEVHRAPKTRGRKTATSESKHDTEEEKTGKTTKARNAVDEPVSKTTKNSKQESIEEPKPSRTRGKKVDSQTNVEAEKTTRGRRAAKPDNTTTEVEVKTRKRKTSAPDNDIPPKVRKSKEVAGRGGKRVTETETTSTRKKFAVKEGKVEKVQSEAPVRATRGRKTALPEPVKPQEPQQKSLRGRKAHIENVPANNETGKRKRVTAAVPSPVEVRSKKQRRGNTSAASPAPRRTVLQEGKPAGRSRRR